jgi:hypothetical protein
MSANSFDPKALLAEATAQAGGLADFGDASFRPALDALCKALDDEAKLSAMGAGILKQKLVGQLVNRLRVEDYFRQHPEIAQEDVVAPLVIVGLPRTGTTKLHRLLSRDPRFWFMYFWESQFPVPMPGETIAEPATRIATGREIVRMMTSAMPKLMAIHPMDADEADEEVMLMEHSFLSAFDAYAQVPGYVAWLDRQDQAPAYRYLKRMLQFLQWQKRQRGTSGERWVLKSPHHLMRMDTLLKVFPGVKVIQTHRDPVQSIPSIASFIHTLWCIYSESADAGAAGRSWSERMRLALKHTLDVRGRAPREQFMDVAFLETVKEPMKVVRRVYEFIGWKLTPEVEARMQAWLEVDAKAHQGGHEYTAAEYGLSDEGIKRDFAEYRQRHINN